MRAQPLPSGLSGPPRVRRRSVLSTLVGTVACVALPQVQAQGRPEKTRVTIAVENKAAFCMLPLLLAATLGYFADEGLDLELAEFPDGLQVLQAVAGGAADVGASAYLHALQMPGRSHNFQSFVLQGRAPQIALGVSAHTLPDYRHPVDLSGKKIGIARVGNLSNLVAHAFLARQGMAASAVSFVPTSTAAAAVAGVRSGQLDAICHAEPVATLLEQKGDVRILADTRTLRGTQSVFGGPMPGTCLQAPADFVRRHPNTVQAMANGMVRSLKWLQTAGPSDLIKAVPEPHFLGDRGLYLAAFNKVREAYSTDGMLSDEGSGVAWRAVTAFDSRAGAERLALSRTYTNEFVARARERLRL